MYFKIYYAALHSLFSLSHAKLRKLYLMYGDHIEEFWKKKDLRLLTKLQWKYTDEQVQRWRDFDLLSFSQRISSLGISILLESEERYPDIFREATPSPCILYLRGDESILNRPSIGLVGSRKMSVYGSQLVQHTVPLLVQAGFVIVSGGAFGIDTSVHKATVDAGGKTIAVLGTGIDIAYPKTNFSLYRTLAAEGHLLLSEFPVGSPAQPYHFPLRNRIIAALSDSIVVVEAQISSGSLITARAALDLGKEVFAYVGNVFDEARGGCHALVQKGEAGATVSPLHLLEQLGCSLLSSSRSTDESDYSEQERRFLDEFTAIPTDQDVIWERSGMSVADFQYAVTMMELKGEIKKVQGTKWIRVRNFFTTES